MISYYELRTPDRRNIYEKLWGIDKKEKIRADIRNKLIQFDSIMIDSGAYSYMSGVLKERGKKMDKYVKEYGNWLKENNDIYEHFFEMDVDSITGIQKVEEYRDYLEKCAGKQSIPVWHDIRGLNYWKKMVKNYKYIAIGGIVSGEYDYKSLGQRLATMIEYAHSYNCKVHVLGYTQLKYLPYINTDSIDSSSWLGGSKYGHLYLYFDKELFCIDLKSIHKKSELYYREFDAINIKAWKLYIDYINEYWGAQSINKKSNSLNEKG